MLYQSSEFNKQFSEIYVSFVQILKPKMKDFYKVQESIKDKTNLMMILDSGKSLNANTFPYIYFYI